VDAVHLPEEGPGPPSAVHRNAVKSRWALRFLLLVGAAMAAVALVLRTGWAGGRLCATAADVLTRVLGETVELDRCEIDPLASAITVEGIRVGGSRDERPIFTARRLLVDLAPLAFGRSMSVERIELDEPMLDLVVKPPAGKDDEEPAGDGCLGVLESLRVDDLQIRDARAHVVLPDGAAVSVEALGLEVARRRRSYAADVHVGGAAFTSGATRVPLDSLEASVLLDPGAERLGVRRLAASAPGVKLDVHGGITRLCRPELALEATLETDLPAVAAQLAPEMVNVAGRVAVQVNARGPVAHPRVATAVHGADVAFGEFDLGSVDLSATLDGDKVTLDELVWPVGAGRAIVRGEVQLAGDFPARADVWTESLPFHELLAKLPIKNTPVMMAIDSEHHLAGHLGGGLVLEGDSSLALHDFRVRNEPWHSAKGRTIVEVPGTANLEAKVRLTPEGITLDPAKATFGPGTVLHLVSRLAFDDEEGLYVRVRAPHFDLAHLRSHVAGIPLAGAGEIQAVLEGPYGDPLIEGDFDLRGGRLFSAQLGQVRAHAVSRPGDGLLEFQGVSGEHGSTSYEANAKLVLGGDPAIDGEIALREGGRLGDLFGATAELVTPLAWLRDHLDGTIVAAHATVKGPLPNIAAEGEIQTRGVRFMDRPFDTLTAKLTVPDITQLRLDEVAITRGAGRADALGVIRFASAPSVDVALDAHDLPLRDLMGSFGEWANLQGSVGARGAIRGRIDQLDIGGELFATKVRAAGVKLPQTRLSLETQGDQVIVRGPVAGAGTLSGAVRLAEDLPFDASLTLDVPKIGKYLPDDFAVQGEVRGVADVTGTLADITGASGTIDLQKLSLLLADYRLEGDGPAQLRFDGASFVLPSLRLRGENTELVLAGTRAASGGLDLQAHGTFDARILDSLLPQIEHATGLVEIKAAVTGTAERPILVGSADVSRGAFRVKALPVQVQRLNGRLAFSQNQVVVEEAGLVVNQGRARLRGTVSLQKWAPDRFDLTLQGDRISWRKPADWPAVLSGRLHLGGAWPNQLRLSGELDVDRLRYARDLDLEKAILDFRQRVRQPPGPDDVERLKLDIDLVGGPDMRVDNNLVRARLQFVAPAGGGKPRLRLVGTNVRIGLLGSVEVLDGIGFFRGNEYRITHGVVDFDKRTEIDPEFDLTAETEIREYKVAVHAYGRLADEGSGGYQLDLGAEPSLAQADILTLLTFGITSKDLDRGGNAFSGAGLAAEALLTVSGLDEHVKRWLPDSQLLLDPEFSVTSQYSEVTGQLEPMATFEAKLLSEQLRLKAAAPFASARGRRASAEYRFNQRLSTQVIWENEETGYSAGDLGLDVKLRWEWE